jgi:hypothetical protein
MATIPTETKLSYSAMGGALHSDSRERRRHARYAFTGTLEAFEPSSETKIQGRTADLSEGGSYVDTMSPFPAGTCVKVRISREKRSFESPATVVYSVSGMGMGLRFDSIDAQQFVSLRKWLAELIGEGVAEVDEEYPETPCAEPTSSCVLNQLINELMRKGILNDSMGREMLQRLA